MTPAPKDAVTCYGISVTWKNFGALMERQTVLEGLTLQVGLSKSYLYALISYIDMARQVNDRPETALWHSRFAYRTRRMLEATVRNQNNPKLAEQERRRLQAELAAEIAHKGIREFGEAYKIALFNYLYNQRD
jgi:CRISPR-associated protein Csm1